MSITLKDGWKQRRTDKRTEAYWLDREKRFGPLNSYEKYQQKWNFIEHEYSHKPSNNDLDFGNPGFAFVPSQYYSKFLVT